MELACHSEVLNYLTLKEELIDLTEVLKITKRVIKYRSILLSVLLFHLNKSSLKVNGKCLVSTEGQNRHAKKDAVHMEYFFTIIMQLQHHQAFPLLLSSVGMV